MLVLSGCLFVCLCGSSLRKDYASHDTQDIAIMASILDVYRVFLTG